MTEVSNIEPIDVLTAAVWRNASMLHEVPPTTLEAAWKMALLNEVGVEFARYHRGRFAEYVESSAVKSERFRVRLTEATGLLADAGVPAVLVKVRLDQGDPYSNFDLVVGPDRFPAAVEALAPWTVRTETHPLEPDKVLMHPEEGPAAHLHQHVGWFGIPVIPGSELLGRADHSQAAPWLLPDAADDLRTYMAHAAYQNLAVPLRELLAVRGHIADAATTAIARRRADDEGWGRSFAAILGVLIATVCDLDAGRTRPLPVWLAPSLAAFAGWEHAQASLRRRDLGIGVRELGLRGPLMAAKMRRRRKPVRPTRGESPPFEV